VLSWCVPGAVASLPSVIQMFSDRFTEPFAVMPPKLATEPSDTTSPASA
jgi:hypothetical protein